MKPQLTTLAVVGSHSALDVCRGAKTLGFKTLVVTAKGRERVYAEYFASDRSELGCVDSTLQLSQFKDILQPDVQAKLQKNCIFIPNRSFAVYVSDYQAIESRFHVPMFGNRFLLRTEERQGKLTQYAFLKKAGIRMPIKFTDPKKIDRLCIAKAPQQSRPSERAFFFANSYTDFQRQKAKLIQAGTLARDASIHIEEYILGAQVNLNFFYSPLRKCLELLGTDTRRQTNLSGFTNLPATDQIKVSKLIPVTFEEAGHMAVTMLESLLEPAFELGERFVKATQELMAPGIIGPFSLQACIVSTGKKKEFVVFDVSPRIPGSPGIAATPYGAYLYGRPLSMGERIAMEIKEAVEMKALKLILT